MDRHCSNSYVPPQFQEILRFQARVSQQVGRDISLSEAIAQWIALGYADEYIERIREAQH